MVQRGGVLVKSHPDPFRSVDAHVAIRFVVRRNQAELQVLRVAGIDKQGGNHLRPFVLVPGDEIIGATKPHRSGSLKVDNDAVGDPALVQVTHDSPKLLELGRAIDRVVIAPVHHIGIRVVIDALPIGIVPDDAEQRHARLVDERVKNGLELVVGPAAMIHVDAETFDRLKHLRTIDRDGLGPKAVA